MGYALCRRPPIIAHGFMITDSWQAYLGILGTWTRYLACLVVSLWRPGDPWAILGHWGAQERTLWNPGLDFYWFVVDFGTLFLKLFGHLGPTNVCWYACFQAFFSNGFRFWIWMSGIGKLSILQRKYCKNQLSQKLAFAYFQIPFFMIWGRLWYQFLGILNTSTYYLACLVASLWRLGEPLGDLGTLGSARKDTLTSRHFYSFFCRFRDLMLKACWVPWIDKCVCCYACFQASFSNGFWVWIWMSRIGKLNNLQRKYCKTQLSQELTFS